MRVERTPDCDLRDQLIEALDTLQEFSAAGIDTPNDARVLVESSVQAEQELACAETDLEEERAKKDGADEIRALREKLKAMTKRCEAAEMMVAAQRDVREKQYALLVQARGFVTALDDVALKPKKEASSKRRNTGI